MFLFRRAVVAASLTVVLALVSSVPRVAAHTEVLRASPGPAETVTGVVDAVELTFLDPVLDGVSIVVTGPDGARVAGLEVAALAADKRSARVGFDALTADGAYDVDYAFAAADGDRQQDRYRFTFRGGLEAGGNGRSAGAVIAVVAVGLSVLVGVVVAVRRRHGE